MLIMRRKRSIDYSIGDRFFLGLIWVLAILFFIIIAYPMLFIVISSFSGGINSISLWLVPKNFSLEGYRAVLGYDNIWLGFTNSIYYVVLGTSISMVLTILCAYPLSRQDFRAKNLIMGLCVFTMYFSGGLIPTYLWVRQLGMMNTAFAILLPGSLNVYNMIVMRTYFNSQIPSELRDAAFIDGSGDWRYLLQIVIPLSMPILAVIGLFYTVNNWNGWFSAFVYLSDRKKYPLALFLREIYLFNETVQNFEASYSDQHLATMVAQRTQMLKYALAVVSTLPMMILYPFVQKFFDKGVMIGALKG